MEHIETRHVKEIAMETSNFLEQLLAGSPSEELNEDELRVDETLRLLKGIVDSIILRKDLSSVEDVLIGLCFLLAFKPDSVDKIRKSLKVIITTEILLEVIEKGGSNGLQQKTDTEGA